MLQIDHKSQDLRNSESELVTTSRTTDPTMHMTNGNMQCRTDTTRFRPCVYNWQYKKNNNRFANYFTNWTTRRKQTRQFNGSIMCASVFQNLLLSTIPDTFSVRVAVESRCLSLLRENMNGTTSHRHAVHEIRDANNVLSNLYRNLQRAVMTKK